MNIFNRIKKHFLAGNELSSFTDFSQISVNRMLKDPQVKAAINIKKMLILKGRQEVHPVSDNPKDKKIADFIRAVLYCSQNTVTELLYNVLDAFLYGFSINEIVYRKFPEGRVGIEKFVSIDPATVSFTYNKYGETENILINGEPIVRDKVVLYTYNGAFGSPYGKNDLLSVYKHLVSKEKLIEDYNIYMKKYVSPVIKGTYKKNITGEQQDKLFSTIKSIKQKTAILIPEDCSVDALNLNSGSGDDYKNAIDYHDRQIAKGILGQTIFTDDNVTVGSYSLANIHLELLDKCLSKIKRDLEETVITEQVIRPLVKYNFPKADYPKFTISDINGDTLKKNAEAILGLINKDVVNKDEFWIRDYLGLPEKSN